MLDPAGVERRHNVRPTVRPTTSAGQHPAVVGERPWSEEHRLQATCSSARGSIVIATQVGHYVPPRGTDHAAFQAVVASPGSDPIVISDQDIPMPAAGWELRTSGLWADHICETPMEHWSYGLEAFALRIDEPTELLGRGYGERVPLGWELEFEATEGPVAASDEAYAQAGTLHGLVLFADGEVEVEGPAVRSHRWGAGTHPVAPTTGIAVPTPVEVWWVALA